MTRREVLKDDKNDIKSLHKRYLFWLYKTTKDELDKIERKSTQLDIDRHIELFLDKGSKDLPEKAKRELEPNVFEWKEYILQKERDAKKLKFTEDGALNKDYLFLRLKLRAIEDVTRARLGKKELFCFKELYEKASMERILEEFSGKR